MSILKNLNHDDSDNPLTTENLKSALRKPWLAQQFGHILVKYESEWYAEIDGEGKMPKWETLNDQLTGTMQTYLDFTLQKYEKQAALEKLKTHAARLSLANSEVDAYLKKANEQITKALAPIEELMERFISRLHHESDDLFRASVGTNFHKINRIPDKQIIEQAGDKLPSYYRMSGSNFEQITNLEKKHFYLIQDGYPDISNKIEGPLKEAFNTFNTLNAVELSAGTKLVRIVDPKSVDNSICWMRVEEFEKLKSRDQWREQFAVKTEWNSNGEYLTYTVPDGETLKAWEGIAASQEIKNTNYFIPGGGVQIVVDPNQLNRLYVSGRKPTNWNYGEVNYIDNGITYIGVPDLTKNIGSWYK